MSRDEVIVEMCEVINDMNRQMAWQNGIPSDQINEVITKMQPELMHGNGLIYDKLVELGVIENSL